MALFDIVGSRVLAPILHILASAVLATASAAASGTDIDRDERTVTGRWRVTAALDGADIASLDEHEAQRLLKQVLVISRDNVRFGSHSCGPSGFEAESVDPRFFVRQQFRASARNLGLPSPVTVVKLNCTAVFIKSPDKVVVFWDGWFFDAVRMH